ncbi:hypothetical protein BS50DRAFT_602381 [Corynespora cassiicola Philippines]|uniref:Peroxisomal membrane protein PEX14 n=1 Tax=Corynespora cassiicola Philippines TaxID=1448308 RepID=A0A2T2NDX9_CORCC|nr:hypothetical protein BS50DRAFT_602381 [Corynespora cassiicola Philippines]
MSHRPRIPSWQQAQAQAQATTPPQPEPEPEPAPEPESTSPEHVPDSPDSPEPQPESHASPDDAEEPARDASDEMPPHDIPLLEQASRFLQDPAIRDAPRDRKAAFLESKGVKSEDINRLLGAAPRESTTEDLEQAGERAWSTAKQALAPRPQPREVPPIVTYPEFLTVPEKPPPLITTHRLLNTAYITGGLFATMYGLSKYIIAPMSQDLTDKRHEFADHTHEQLKDLNKRLGDAVSIDPAKKVKPISDILDDVSEADSDPTELYHRDFGTQTTPNLSRRASVATNVDPEPMVSSHENRLKILTSHLRELEATRSNDKASSDSLKTKLSDLSTYLSEMSYQNQYYNGMGSFYGSNYGLPRGKDGKEDQIEVLKSDIRAVKGVFLSARNFPAGGRNTPPMGRVGG